MKPYSLALSNCTQLQQTSHICIKVRVWSIQDKYPDLVGYKGYMMPFVGILPFYNGHNYCDFLFLKGTDLKETKWFLHIPEGRHKQADKFASPESICISLK